MWFDGVLHTSIHTYIDLHTRQYGVVFLTKGRGDYGSAAVSKVSAVFRMHTAPYGGARGYLMAA